VGGLGFRMKLVGFRAFGDKGPGFGVYGLGIRDKGLTLSGV
jgi:hypothetical protein